MKKLKHYPEDFKFKVVCEVLEGKITKAECRRKYGIKGKSLVLDWMRKFDNTYQDSVIMKNDKSEEIKKLQQRIKELEKELDYERIKSISYLEMIKIAEEELKIPIRKKPGAKQSKK